MSFNWRQNHPVLFHPMMYLSRSLFLKYLHYTIKSKGWPFYNIYTQSPTAESDSDLLPHTICPQYPPLSPSPSASSLFCLARKDIHCIQNPSLPVSINSLVGNHQWQRWICLLVSLLWHCGSLAEKKREGEAGNLSERSQTRSFRHCPSPTYIWKCWI